MTTLTSRLRRNRLRSWDLVDKVVLITGAANGIGAGTARALHHYGCKLVLLDVDADRLGKLAGDLGDRVLALPVDVTDPIELRQAAANAVGLFGRLDVAVANAGVGPVDLVATMGHERFVRTVDTNLIGVWNTVQATLPHLRASGGYLLAVSSLAAAVHLPLMSHYAASKAGVEALMDSLAGELSGDSVDIGVAYFSFIDTEMVRAASAYPGAVRLNSMLPRFLTAPLPLSRAVAAMVEAIERRRRRTAVPSWIRPVLLTPGLFRLVNECLLRLPRARRALREVEEDERRRN